MGGLQKFFLRITPIIMLICFVCLGITHTFQQQGQPNITYLTSEVITIDDNNTPTDTTDDITVRNYEFDFKSYRENISDNKLKNAVSKTFDFTTYTEVLDAFNTIWEDGYQFGDGVQTIVNAVILVINSIIVPINIILVPLRIICAVILTGMSLMGININRNTAIISALNGIINNLNIPFIAPTHNQDDISYKLLGEWQFNNQVTIGSYNLYEFNFTDQYNDQYDAIRINTDGATPVANGYIEYRIRSTDTWIRVYYLNSWNDPYFQEITITSIPEDEDVAERLWQWLYGNATKIE